MKDLQDDCSVRDLAADSPLLSFFSLPILNAALTADAKSRVTKHIMQTPTAKSLSFELAILDSPSADYLFEALDNYSDLIPLKLTHKAFRDYRPPGDPASASSKVTLSRFDENKKKVSKKKKTKKTCRIKNPDILRTDRVEAPGGTAGRRRAALASIDLFGQKTQVPCTRQGIAETSLERLSRSTDKRNPI